MKPSLPLPPTGPVLLVGCGNMAGAMLDGWLAAGLDPAQVTAISPSLRPMPPGVTVLPAPPPDGAAPAIVMLGVKPQRLDEVAASVAPLLAPETILVSILAGTELDALRRRFPVPRAIVRVMPNTPAAIRQGVLALIADGLDDTRRKTVEALMATLGLVEWIKDEALFDAVTALSGSGPAFLFRFIDALAAAGAARGLPTDQAARIALATIAGSAALAAGSDADPTELARRVTSPGGSTARGLEVLDAALPDLLAATIAASERRNAELAAATRA